MTFNLLRLLTWANFMLNLLVFVRFAYNQLVKRIGGLVREKAGLSLLVHSQRVMEARLNFTRRLKVSNVVLGNV